MTSGSWNTAWRKALEQPRQLRVRKLLAWLHLLCGAAFGVFLVMMGLSGSALVFKDQIDLLLSPQLLASQPASPAVTLDGVVRTARLREPGLQPIFVDFGTQPAAAVYLSRDGGWYPSRDVEAVYVDRGTGVVLGTRNYGRGVMNRLMHLHTELCMGARGAAWLGALALVLLCLVATGYLLWWPGRTRWKRAVRVDWAARWPRRTWDLHQVGGLVAGLPLGLQAATAVALTLPVLALPVLSGVLPGRLAELDSFDNPQRSGLRASFSREAGLDSLAARSQALYPEYRIQNVTMPVAKDDPVVFVMGDSAFEERGAQARVAFDRFDGATLSNIDSRRGSLLLRAYVLLGPLHFGRVLGVWTEGLWVLLGWMPTLLFATGFAMWWRRVVAKRLRQSR